MVLDGFRIPMESGNFKGKSAAHCKVMGWSAVSCAKTAEPIEMLFGLWARMGCRNHVLNEDPDCPTQRHNF